MRWPLVSLRPVPDVVEIPASMLGSNKVGEGLWLRLIVGQIPDVAEDSDISCTYELFPEDVHVMR